MHRELFQVWDPAKNKSHIPALIELTFLSEDQTIKEWTSEHMVWKKAMKMQKQLSKFKLSSPCLSNAS